VSNTSDLTNIINAINAVAGTTGITATMGATNATINLTDHDGNEIYIADFANSTSGNDTIQVTALDFAGTSEVGSAVTLTEGGTIDANVTCILRLKDTPVFTVCTEAESDGSTASTTIEGYFSATSGKYSGGVAATADSSLAAVSAVDVGTSAGAKAAIDILDGALRMVST
jgi:flagellin